MKLPEGSRKLIFFSLLMLVNYIAYMFGSLPAEAYQSVMWAAALGFGGGNVGEHWSNRK